MIEIKKMEDINKLKKKKGVYSDEFIDYMEGYFYELWQEFAEGERLQDYSLEDCGYIVVLEKEDDLEDLSEVGLNKEDRGLIGVIPEWIELKELKDGSKFYHIEIVYNNEFVMIFYISKSITDKEKAITRWIHNNL